MTPPRQGWWAWRPTAPRRRAPVLERGSATAEFAVSLPALMIMIFVALAAVTSVRTQLECVDAAREAARAEARGEPGEAAGRRVAPTGAAVSVAVEGETVRATVSARVHPLGGRLPGFDVSANATALIEPGVTGT